MPMLLGGSCHCRKIKYTLASNTPVPYQLCQCSICRKVGGYTGSVNIMGNTDTLNILHGKELIKKYKAPVKFDDNDHPTKITTSERSFCSECSTMLWNYHPEWPHWIYPFASSIDTELPAPPEGVQPYAILRSSCPDYVPTPEGWKVYKGYGPGKSIEEWHKANGAWID